VSTAAYYPVVLDLSERRCVVLGDTEIATEKVATMEAIGASVVHARRPFQAGDLVGAFLAIDASGDPISQAGARAEADRERVLLNVVDVAQRCDWIAPAVVRRGPLQVAISTSGESPFLARVLRERLEQWLGEEWGPFMGLVGRTRRRLRRAGVAGAVQQRVYQRLLRSEILDKLRAGNADAAHAIGLAIEQSAYDRSEARPMGEVVLAGAGPGDPGLVTMATRAVLADADVVLHDALVDPEVLRLCGSQARIIDVGKRAGRPSIAQTEINEAMITAASAGNLVVRLKGGDPFLFGRGGEEVDALQRAGVPVRVIPGVSAALAAPAIAGIPLTHRGTAGSVAIVTGHRADDAQANFEHLALSADTLVVLMPSDLDVIARRLSAVLGSARPAAVISRATTPEQRVVRAPLGRIAAAVRAAGIDSPSTLVVGEVVNLLAIPEQELREAEPLTADAART
jgi:uroporphyrin-III C-methyltransferase / precorrin-2 dehydrogenase / sirohydrochlorin ferrochelatase